MGNNTNEASPGLGSLTAAAVALIGGVGALTLTGALGRVQRNQGEAFAVALALVALAPVIWIGAGYVSKEHTTTLLGKVLSTRSTVRTASSVVGFIGVAIGFTVAVLTASETEQPIVTLKVDGQTLRADASATVSNLSSNGQLSFYVDALTEQDDDYRVVNLYRAFVGPNAEGNASHSTKVDLPPGAYDALGVRAFTAPKAKRCDYEGREEIRGEQATGCIVARLPIRSPRPQVSGSWERTRGEEKVLKVVMEVAHPAAGNPTDALVMLRVLGFRNRNRGASLYRTVLAPTGDKPTKRSFRLPIGRGIRTVCIEARMIKSGDEVPDAACPTEPSERLGVVEMKVPPTTARSDR